jgi:hypothetical protein
MPSSLAGLWLNRWLRRPGSIVLLTIFGFSCFSRRAAAETLRIVVAVASPGGTTLRRLEAELRSRGLTVIEVDSSSARDSREHLSELAQQQSAIAAVQLVDRGSKVEVWIADRVTGKTVFRELSVASGPQDGVDDSIAVGVAELLRASLMELNAPAAPRGDYPVTRSIQALAYVPPPPVSPPAKGASQLRLSAAFGMGAGMRGIGPTALVSAAAGWATRSGLGIEGLVGDTIVAGTVERSNGKASVGSFWFGGGASFESKAIASIFAARAGAGFAGARIRAKGESATVPFVTDSESRWSAGPYVHGSVGVGSASLRLVVDASVLVLLSVPPIRFADQRIGTWGQPAMFYTLGAEWLLR